MSYYDPTITPPRPSEVTSWVRDTLAADMDLQAAVALGGAGRVYRLQPGTQPDRFLVVRQRKPAGGRVQSLSRKDAPVVQVMSECTETLFTDFEDIDEWHTYVQELVFKALVGQKPTLSNGDAVLPFERITVPSEAAYAADTESYYSTAEYQNVIGP